MKPFNTKLQKNEVTFIRRAGGDSPYVTRDDKAGPSVTMPCSIQTPNATAGPPFFEIVQSRLAAGSEFRIVLQKVHIDEAFSSSPYSWPSFVRNNDFAVINGDTFRVDGKPVPRAHDFDGAVLIWAVDITAGE